MKPKKEKTTAVANIRLLFGVFFGSRKKIGGFSARQPKFGLPAKFRRLWGLAAAATATAAKTWNSIPEIVT